MLRYWASPAWTERARAERFVAGSARMAEDGSGARLAIDRVSGSVHRMVRSDPMES